MAKQTIFSTTVTAGGLGYTATLDKGGRTEDGTWPVRVSCSNGLAADGGWDDGIFGISYGGAGELAADGIEALDEAMRKALRG